MGDAARQTTRVAKHFGLAAPVLNLAVGVIAAVALPAISEGQMRITLDPSRIAWSATAFWALVCLATLSSASAARFAPSRDDLVSLQQENARLKRLSVTTPHITALVQQTTKELDEHRTDAKACVRSVLRALCHLAWLVDGRPDAARYAANVMLFVPDRQRASLHLPPLRFHDQQISLQGVLTLRAELSALREWPVGADDRLEPFCLPVPAVSKKDGRVCALPGAPRAFIDGAPVAYEDADRMLEWSEAESAFSPAVREELRSYLGSPAGSLVKSFIALPLQSVTPVELGALVNIHRDHPGILAEYAEEFVELAQPFLQHAAFHVARVVRLDKTQRDA
jgi:hypothetical protein